MATILVVGEQANGHLKKATLSALTAAQQVAQNTGGNIAGVVIGAGAGQAAQELAAYGIPVHVVEGAAFEHALAETHSAAAVEGAKKAGADEVVIAATAYGKDIAPRIAAKLGAGLASDVLAIAGANQFKRAMWAGNVLAEVELSTHVKAFTIRTTEFEAARRGGAPGTVLRVDADAGPEGSPKVRHLGFQEVKSERPALTEARVVVSGGRGTKGDFAAVEGLADALGAAVGASRAAVDAGWVPNDWQVGQTGKVVAPELYVAAGISGAIQHLAGMKGARVVVAVNKDPEAPIFQIADYGLVGDLFQALPALAARAKAAR